MPNIQIKDVPAETHAVWTRRAAQNHQSLQAYLLQYLIDRARVPTNRELFDEIERRGSGVSLNVDEVVGGIREDRDRR